MILRKKNKVYKNTKREDVYVIHYSTSFKPWHVLSDISLFNKKEWVKLYYPFYELWFKLFIEVYDNFWNNNINILNLESQFKNLEKYLKRAYPDLKVVELTDFQNKKLINKLNEKITKSGKNSDKYTYKNIIDVLNKGKNRVYIVGGAVRNLYNDDKINDIDLCYDILPDKLEDILSNKFI